VPGAAAARKPLIWGSTALAVVVAAVGAGVASAQTGAFRAAGAAGAAGTVAFDGLALAVSATPDRAQPAPLSGATVRGRAYIQLAVPAPASGPTVASVTFYLDNPLGAPVRTEREQPYDFWGGAPDGSANAFDTASLTDGPHAVLVDVAFADGSVRSLYSRFTVANRGAPPSATPRPSATSTVPPTTQPTTQPPTQPGARSCPPVPAYPTPGCTGVPAGAALRTVSGDYTAQRAGEVVDGVRITGVLRIAAHDVTVRNTEVHGGVTNYRNGATYRFTITDTTVGAPSGCNGGQAVGVDKYTATRLHIRNFGDGFRDSGDNILIQDSFVKLCSNPGDHSDGVQGYFGGSNVIVRHNTIDQRSAQSVTSPIFMADGSKGGTFEDNLLAGGGYTVRLHDGTFRFTGNRIVDGSWQYGPVYSACASVNPWSDNTLVRIDDAYRITGTIGLLRCG
jgi:hypothetical protein